MFYHILLLPLIAGLTAQIIKFFIQSNGTHFSAKNLVAYSGMPSGHTAITISLATIIGLEEGLNSSLFAITIIFAIIVIRDALGFRRYLGKHGHTLNVLVKDLKDDQVLQEEYPHLLEKIGHTPAQVIVGAMIGFLISFLGFSILY